MNRAFVLLLLAGLPLAGQAAIYRWVDAQGQVHYTQTPPPGVAAERKAGAPPPSAPAAPTSPAPAATAPKPAAPAKPDEKVEREARAKRCNEAREYITYLEDNTARRLGVPQADGSLARMTDEEFEERLKKAQATTAKDCAS